MTRSSQIPFTEIPISCPHCANAAPMQLLAKVDMVNTEGKPPYEINFYHEWQLLRCQTCLKVTLIHEVSDSEHEYDLDDGMGGYQSVRDSYLETLYPPKRKVFQYVPVDVAESYEVAARLLYFEPVACAVFIGRTLEFLCKDRMAKGKTLDSMLRNLAEKDEIPKSLLEMALNLKDFRNLGAHATKLKLSRQDAELLLQICEVILEYVYESSQMLEAVKKRIAEVKADDK